MSDQQLVHIYLSPHLDDVALSCGGAIYNQIRAGERVIVVSFFAGSPADADLTAYTSELRERWDQGQDPVAARRQEDMVALARLGALPLHLGFLDCPYRQGAEGTPLYPTEESIFGEVHPYEAGWHEVLLAQMSHAIQEFLVVSGLALHLPRFYYAPLAAGHHIDHVIVRRMARLLVERDVPVLFYEDYPYAGDADAIEAALEGWPGAVQARHTTFFDDLALEVKGEAVACYRSQISTFWQSDEEMQEALATYARAVGGQRYGENYWQLDAKSPPRPSLSEFIH
jgi:LmbE family N-acetylglucosaminyl deacetylase